MINYLAPEGESCPTLEDIEEAKKLDRQDPLAKFRERFLNRDHEIYLDGNSLGKLPLAAIPVLEETISNQWGKQLIRSWNKNWLELPKRLSRKYCELLNADEGELVFGESTSVRIYQIIFQELLRLKIWIILMH